MESCYNQQVYLASIMDDSAITFNEIIESCDEETNFNEKKAICKTQKLYILFAFLLVTTRCFFYKQLRFEGSHKSCLANACFQGYKLLTNFQNFNFRKYLYLYTNHFDRLGIKATICKVKFFWSGMRATIRKINNFSITTGICPKYY